jgi:hypothetical protein
MRASRPKVKIAFGQSQKLFAKVSAKLFCRLVAAAINRGE